MTEYQKAPRVTRERLYIEAIEEVYGNSSKVLVDSEGSGNMLYLPLDKIVQTSGRQPRVSEANRAADSQLPPNSEDSRDTRDSARDRRTRQ